MSALGQKQTLGKMQLMSALPSKADIPESDWHVRFVPKADIVGSQKLPKEDITDRSWRIRERTEQMPCLRQ